MRHAGRSLTWGRFLHQNTMLPFTSGSFRKYGVHYLGVLIIRILLFRVLYCGPLISSGPWIPQRRNPDPRSPGIGLVVRATLPQKYSNPSPKNRVVDAHRALIGTLIPHSRCVAPVAPNFAPLKPEHSSLANGPLSMLQHPWTQLYPRHVRTDHAAA